MKQRGFVPIMLVIVLAVIGIVIAYYFGTLRKNENQLQSTSTPAPSETSSLSPISEPTAKPNLTVNGAELAGIKYTLPSTWESKPTSESLTLSPKTGGGFLVLKAYNYPGDMGRRDYYCKLVGYCIKETYFESMNIGNISGYKASALDNSGGGDDYFGAKGNKIYIINSYNPPSPTEFEKSYRQVLNSLVF